jgi:hypothetical protein
MSNPKTEITGEVQTIDEKVGKKNPWYIVTILGTRTEWDGKTSECVYQFKAFGKVCEKVKGMAVGDYIKVACEVGSRTWTNESTGKTSIFTELSAESIEVLNNAVPTIEVEKDTNEQVTNGEASQDPLPF